MSQILSLYELNQLIRSVVEMALPETFLVTSEIASLRLDRKNHCYLELIDKDEDVIRAEMKAVIWSDRYRKLSAEFQNATGTELARGIKILFEAEVTFHERYGLKLNILNIDPSYTIGELAVRRKEILDRLTSEGLKDRNKSLEFPLVPQRIGIISSPNAAGYEDLLNHLTDNPYGYKFFCRLYEAVMQGDRAEASIVNALSRCRDDSAFLDVVVIVRGGGGQIDLHCFDSYEIGKAVALLPLPVISGIGHERDITVVDDVSNTRVKTPTAAADLLITKVKGFEDSVDSLGHSLVHGVRRLTSDLKETLSFLAKNLEGAVRKEFINSHYALTVLIKGLRYALNLIRTEKERLKSRENNLNHLNPLNVLKRGYSITYNNGKAVKSVSEVRVGDNLKTIIYSGELTSKVESTKKNRR